MSLLIKYIIFPGFLFTAIVGMVASWIDRKVTARVQWRVGPPFLQPFYDFVKLLGKEIIIPKGGSKWVFLSAPLFGLAAITFVSTLLWLPMLGQKTALFGDLIVVMCMLAVPSVAMIVGGFASQNPLASLGASREAKLILSYELPFIIASFIPVIKAKTIDLASLLAWQAEHGMFLAQPSGMIAFVVLVLCMQAKLGLIPFDMPEAETEIMAGAYIEYSGAPLAVYKLTRSMMLFTVPMFVVVLLMGGIVFSGIHALWGVLKYVLLLVTVILMRNTNPRLRIDQATRFFLITASLLAAAGAILALIGA